MDAISTRPRMRRRRFIIESKEETGLTIRHPKFTGIYHWMRDGVRNMGFLYKTKEAKQYQTVLYLGNGD